MAKILDDFLLITPANYLYPQLAYDLMLAIFKMLSIPLAGTKCVAPCKRLIYLGLELDIGSMTIRLPEDKVQRCLKAIETLLLQKKAKVQQIQSVAGLLQFACRAIVPGRPFLRRLYDAITGISSKPYYFVRLTASLKHDLQVWLQFLTSLMVAA